MWAVLGSAIGIRDDYNVCLQPSLDEARVYFKQMMNRYLIPALFYMKDNDDAKILYESFVKVGHFIMELIVWVGLFVL
jgi:hypothetical protein